MSMFDVARFLSYSRSIDTSSREERFFNVSMANSGHLFSCLHGDSFQRCLGRRDGNGSERYFVRGFGK